MIIRKYKSTDCKYLAQLFYDTVHSVNSKDYSKEQLNAWATGNIDLKQWDESFKKNYTIVALENNIIVGFGDIDKTGYLDRLYVHKDYQEYIDAKKNIFKYQDKNGIIVLNADNEITNSCKDEANGKVIMFSSKEKLENGFIVDTDGIIKECNEGIRRHIIDTKDLKLKGMHNFQNVCTVLALTKELVDADDAAKTIKEFAGVCHRQEYVRTVDGVEWYNDSASTSPTRGISALNAFKDKEIILIAGGADKNLDYTPIGKPIVDNVKSLILIGQTANKIYEAVKNELENQHKQLNIHMCDTFEQSMNLAKRIAKPGQIVLFSPASTSFDMFKDMYDRGDQFKNMVMKF